MGEAEEVSPVLPISAGGMTRFLSPQWFADKSGGLSRTLLLIGSLKCWPGVKEHKEEAVPEKVSETLLRGSSIGDGPWGVSRRSQRLRWEEMRAFSAKDKPASLPTLRRHQLSIGEMENGLVQANGKAWQGSVLPHMFCVAVAGDTGDSEQLQILPLGLGHPRRLEDSP